MVKCPSHDDKKGSLSIKAKGDGGLVLNCFAGCDWKTVRASLNLAAAPTRTLQSEPVTARSIVAEYEYRDATGKTIATKRRWSVKSFDWISRDEHGVRRTGLPEGGQSLLPLYRLPELLEAVARKELVFVVEGEKDADALQALGLTATCNPEGASGAVSAYSLERWQPLAHASVVVLPDNDEPGKAHAAKVADVLRTLGAIPRVLNIPSLPPKGDVSDFLNGGGTADQLRALATTPLPADNGAELLEQVIATLRRFVVLSDEAMIALGLFVLHTHAIGAAELTPYMAIGSPTRESGKTTLLNVLDALVAAPFRADSATAPALYRLVDVGRGNGQTDKPLPTLLLDELDAVFSSSGGKSERAEALRGVLNSGFKIDGATLVCDGDRNEPRKFHTFCPKVLAGIGKLPDTITSRSIPIEMARATCDEAEALEPARRRTLQSLAGLRDALSEWGQLAVPRLLKAPEPILEGVSARQSDIWGPLLAIAKDCDGEWLTKATAAARVLHADKGDTTDGRDAGIALLADLRALFECEAATYIRSARLAELLRLMEDRPWPEYSRGGPITVHAVARLLKPYGISPKHERISAQETIRAYFLADCREAFRRYLPSDAQPTIDTSGTPETGVASVPVVPICTEAPAPLFGSDGEQELEPLPF